MKIVISLGCIIDPTDVAFCCNSNHADYCTDYEIDGEWVGGKAVPFCINFPDLFPGIPRDVPDSASQNILFLKRGQVTSRREWPEVLINP